MCLELRDVDVLGVRFFGNAVSTFGRNELVHWALDEGASHMLWIDTDSMFPPRAARALLSHDLPFVGANFALKDGSQQSAMWGLDGGRLVPRDIGVEEVSTLGMGLTLVAREVLEAVGAPWFRMDVGERGGPCDDEWFSRRAREEGYPPYVDHGLSRECAHVGLWPHRLPGA